MDNRTLINSYSIDELRDRIILRKTLIKKQNISNESIIYLDYVYMVGRLNILEEQQKEVKKILDEINRCNEGIRNTPLGMSVNKFLNPRTKALKKIKEYELEKLSDIKENKIYKKILSRKGVE